MGLSEDPANQAAFARAEMALEAVRQNLESARSWTKERIAGEYLPQQYLGIFGKPPKMTRPSLPRHKQRMQVSETMRFIQAVLSELGISYSSESIIAAMQAAKKTKRHR
jgi:hypothetical protein